MGYPVPEPSHCGKFIQLPNSLYARLVDLTKPEGISINALVSTLIAESIGKREVYQGG